MIELHPRWSIKMKKLKKNGRGDNIYTARAKKNAIKDSYEKESAVSLIKKFVIHLWNPEMVYLNKQL
jgi:hypothetical protein